MNGKVFCTSVNCGQYNGSNEPDVRTVAVCTHGVHVKYTIETLFSNSNDLLFANMGKIECEACDGSCRMRHDMRSNQPNPKDVWRGHVEHLRQHGAMFNPEPMQRLISQTIYSDGDSGCMVRCHGQYHVEELCDEFGMGWYPGEIKPCDCHLRTNIVMPEPVAKRVKKFLTTGRLNSNLFLSSIRLRPSLAFSDFLGMPEEILDMSTHARFVGFSDEVTRSLALQLFAGPSGLHKCCSKISPGFELELMRSHFRRGDWCLYYPCYLDDAPCIAIMTRSLGQTKVPRQDWVQYVGEGYLLLDAAHKPIKGSFRRIPVLA